MLRSWRLYHPLNSGPKFNPMQVAAYDELRPTGPRQPSHSSISNNHDMNTMNMYYPESPISCTNTLVTPPSLMGPINSVLFDHDHSACPTCVCVHMRISP
jgi:hypothetical protein